MAQGNNSTESGLDLPSSQWAAQFNPSTRRAEINQVPIPSIKPDEILVKVRAASLCHSDLMLFEDNEQGLILGEGTPFTMGHEACGIILQTGSEVGAHFQPGDKIGWLPIVDCCFDCEGCQLSNLRCERDTSKIQGMKVDGFFQPYCAINWRNAAKIPEGMQLENLAPMFCAGCTAYNAVNDTIKELTTEPAKTYVAVIGCGGLGHLGIQYLKAYGYIVIGVDISPDALTEAVAQKADHVFNSSTDVSYVEQIKAITGGRGCHAAINYTNSAASYTAMPDLLRTNGLLMVAGIPQKPLSFNAFDITMNRYQIRGSNNGITPKLVKCLEFSQKHGIVPRVTQFKLEQFQEMLDLMQSNKHKGRLGVLFD